MKYILKVILFVLLIMLVAGLVFGFAFKNKNIDDKKFDNLAFVDEWSLMFGTGENALLINQDTQSIIVDDMSIAGSGGDFTEFKCNDKTFVDKIMIRFSVNNDVWNAPNVSGGDIYGNFENRTYEYNGNKLYKNMYSDYYNANKLSLNLKSGDCISIMSIDITFMMPESLKIFDDFCAGKIDATEHVKLFKYVLSLNIPILIK